MSARVRTTPSLARCLSWQDSIAGRPGILAAMLWGLAEATFFFVIPDVFLSFVAILDWPRTSKHALAAIAGALLGGAALFEWAVVDSAAAQAAVTQVPFIRERMFLKVPDGFRHLGGPCSSVPSPAFPTSFTRWKRRNSWANSGFFW